jgi:hypothetical protein
MSDSKKVHWLLWPFWAIWRLLFFIIELTGRLVGGILGLVFMIVGIVATITVIGAVVGIPVPKSNNYPCKIRRIWYNSKR